MKEETLYQDNSVIVSNGLNSTQNDELDDVMNEIVPEELKEVRELIDKYKRDKDNFSEGLIAQAYTAARATQTGNFNLVALARAMNIKQSELKNYLENYPKFASAVRLGIIDGKSDLKDKLTNSIYEKAVGGKIIEKTKRIHQVLNKYGDLEQIQVTEDERERYMPPDVAAAQKLLARLDPTWKEEKAGVNFNITNNELNISNKNVNIPLDYSKMSPATIKELLNSVKINETGAGRGGKDENKRLDGTFKTSPIEVTNEEVKKSTRKKKVEEKVEEDK